MHVFSSTIYFIIQYIFFCVDVMYSGEYVDLPQVDLERNASSERERRSRSREVDLSYLQGFQLHFPLKNVNKLLAIN